MKTIKNQKVSPLFKGKADTELVEVTVGVGGAKKYIIFFLLFSLFSHHPVFAKGIDPEEKVYYYLHDHLGGVDAVLDEEGDVVERRDYLPYGSERLAEGGMDGSTNSPASEDYGFTGKELDEETGLYYYGARYYDPVIGRFVAPDAWEGDLRNPQTLNKYSYSANNPINYIDPTGNLFESAWDALNSALDFGAIVKNEVEILKDIAQYTYGHITRNQELKTKADENISKNSGELKTALIDLAFDTAATAIPFVPAGVTKGKRVAEEVKEIKKASVVIGENMKRVTEKAKEIGAKWYNARTKNPANFKKNNKQWIQKQMREQKTIYDIGRDPNRLKNNEKISKYYKLEQEEIKKRQYPVKKLTED